MKIRTIIILLFIILIALNYSFLDSKIQGFLIQRDSVEISRVIDGDTIETSSGEKIRLLGINSPELHEEYSEQAKEFLENRILNKTVYLEYGSVKKDLYKRTLAYVFVNGRNVNQEMVSRGFANPYFPEGKDKYYKKFFSEWEQCEENFCEKSLDICSGCIELKEFDHYNEIIVFYNKCSVSCDLTNWTIKDEGRKKFIFPEFEAKALDNFELIVVNSEKENTQDVIYWNHPSYVWTYSGDTLFLRDSKGKLVLWKNY